MKLVHVRIQGTSALLQHRFSEAAEADPGTRNVNVQRGTPREQAEAVVYRAPDGTFYHPAAALARLLREAGASHKQRGSRRSVKYIVPAAVIIPVDTVPLLNGKGPAEDYEVDSRPVTIPATKGRIMRHRPRFDEWSMEFSLEIDEGLLPADLIQQLLTEGGMGIGLGDYRPEKGGPFGRFRVISWQEVVD